MTDQFRSQMTTVHRPLIPGVCILFTHFLKFIYVLWPLALCMVSIQERVIVACVYGNLMCVNGVLASGWDKEQLSYMIYSALFMPHFHEGWAVLDGCEFESQPRHILNFFFPSTYNVCNDYWCCRNCIKMKEFKETNYLRKYSVSKHTNAVCIQNFALSKSTWLTLKGYAFWVCWLKTQKPSLH